MKKKVRRFSIIEMMIVMSIFIMIVSVVSKNWSASINKGKIFKSVEGAKRIFNILIIEGYSFENDKAILWQDVVKNSPLGSKNATKDGWGLDYQVSQESGKLVVRSTGYENHLLKTGVENEADYWEE